MWNTHIAYADSLHEHRRRISTAKKKGRKNIKILLSSTSISSILRTFPFNCFDCGPESLTFVDIFKIFLGRYFFLFSSFDGEKAVNKPA
jgi:hypothetical protein